MIERRRLMLGLGASLAMVSPARALAAPSRFAWPQGKQAAVSLTYDDGLNSQLDIAAPQLEAHGLRGTFFLTETNMQGRLADWMALEARGHEIGDHTVSHPCELRPFTPKSFEAKELAPVEAYLDAHFTTPRPRLFAYPCGATELGRRGGHNARRRAYLSDVQADFRAARTVDGGPNDPRLVGRFRYLLQAQAPTYDLDDPKPALDYVRSALDRGYWAILIFHDVLEARRGEGDTSRAVHEAILDWLAGQPVWCAPMGKAFDYILAQGAATPAA